MIKNKYKSGNPGYFSLRENHIWSPITLQRSCSVPAGTAQGAGAWQSPELKLGEGDQPCTPLCLGATTARKLAWPEKKMILFTISRILFYHFTLCLYLAWPWALRKTTAKTRGQHPLAPSHTLLHLTALPIWFFNAVALRTGYFQKLRIIWKELSLSCQLLISKKLVTSGAWWFAWS